MEIEIVIITLAVIGIFFLFGAWICQLHLKEFNFNVKFYDNSEPPKQLKK
jgi:hypothetical protein